MAHAKAFLFVRSLLLLSLLALAACSESTTALFSTGRLAVLGGAKEVEPEKLDRRFRYLRVTHDAGVSILVLGFLDRDANGPVEVWYSFDGELIRLQHGRVTAVTGLKPEWRSVTLPRLPAWSELAKAQNPVEWTRTRDVMPGYRYGVRDRLALRTIDPPRGTALVGLDPKTLSWFEERTTGDGDKLPVARYAVRGDQAVYGEQCLGAETCFKWQRWPPDL